MKWDGFRPLCRPWAGEKLRGYPTRVGLGRTKSAGNRDIGPTTTRGLSWFPYVSSVRRLSAAELSESRAHVLPVLSEAQDAVGPVGVTVCLEAGRVPLRHTAVRRHPDKESVVGSPARQRRVALIRWRLCNAALSRPLRRVESPDRHARLVTASDDVVVITTVSSDSPTRTREAAPRGDPPTPRASREGTAAIGGSARSLGGPVTTALPPGDLRPPFGLCPTCLFVLGPTLELPVPACRAIDRYLMFLHDVSPPAGAVEVDAITGGGGRLRGRRGINRGSSTSARWSRIRRLLSGGMLAVEVSAYAKA